MIPVAIEALSTQREQLDPQLTLVLCKRPKTTCVAGFATAVLDVCRSSQTDS